MTLQEIIAELSKSPRVAGHTRDSELIDFLSKYIKKSGRKLKKDTYPFRAWELIGRPSLKIDGKIVAVQPVAWTGSTDGEIEGVLEKTTSIKTFEAYEFQRFLLKDKDGDVKAFFISRPDFVWLQPTNEPEKLPGAMFGPEVYREVSAKLENKKRVRATFSMQTRLFDSEIVNLVSPAEETPKIIVGAHYDSVSFSPGANDNATGVASVLKLMEKFAFRSDIEFILFAAEEWNKYGSYAFVNGLKKAEIKSIKYFLNYDMTGSKGGKIYCMGHEQFAPVLKKIVGEEDFSTRQPIPFDSWPFCKRDVPVIQFGSSSKEMYFHTPNDTLDHVDLNLVQQGIDFGEEILTKI